MSETLIIGLQCLRGKSQEERRGQKHPKLAQVGRGSPGYINRTEDGPEDDRGLQEIRKQETRRRLADFFDNKEKDTSQETGDCEPGELAKRTQRGTPRSSLSLCRVNLVYNRSVCVWHY